MCFSIELIDAKIRSVFALTVDERTLLVDKSPLTNESSKSVWDSINYGITLF